MGARAGMEYTGNILGMILLAVFGGILLFGLEDVQWNENIPEIPSWQQAWISAATTGPWWLLDRGKRTGATWLWYGAGGLVSMGLSLLTHGALGRGLAAWTSYPLYRTVQTIRILGVLQRLEAFLAGAVLMGAFGLLLILAEPAGTALDILLPKVRTEWKGSGLMTAVFLLEWAARLLPEDMHGWMETVFWGFLPLLALWVVGSTKSEKNT
mgnify:CR=1 FL=1